jgi:aminoglycoside phosphotransferase (APT) family kinase protein
VPGTSDPAEILASTSPAGLLDDIAAALAAVHRMPAEPALAPAAEEPLAQLRALHDHLGEPHPVFELAFRTLGADRPPERSTLVHGDFRIGNLMVDRDRVTGVLDWELSHIGDFHEDLGWIVQRLFAGPAEDGEVLACSLLARDELIERYEAATGRTVNHRTLAFYELLAAYKCTVMNLGTGYSAAVRGHNHQDVLLSFLAPVAHVFLAEIARIISLEG